MRSTTFKEIISSFIESKSEYEDKEIYEPQDLGYNPWQE